MNSFHKELEAYKYLYLYKKSCYIKSRNTIIESTAISVERSSKVGWYEEHEHQVYMNKRLKSSLQDIRDCIVARLSRFQNSWKNIQWNLQIVDMPWIADKALSPKCVNLF